MTQCHAITKKGNRCKNSSSPASSYCHVHANYTEDVIASPRTADEVYPFTRDELIKYVELDLWSRFRSRLFALLGGTLALATLAGLFGIPYYINTELTSRLHQSTIEFDHKVTEILRHAKLLTLLSVRYNNQVSELKQDVDYYLRRIENYNDAQSDENKIKDWTLNRIKQLANREGYHTLEEGYPFLEIPVANAQGVAQIAEPKTITNEIVTSTGATISSHAHPVQDGTLAGVINDIRYRALSLEAFRRAMNALREELLELGADKPVAKRIERVGVVSLGEEKFLTVYEETLDILAKQALPKEQRQKFEEYIDLYAIDVAVEG